MAQRFTSVAWKLWTRQYSNAT